MRISFAIFILVLVVVENATPKNAETGTGSDSSIIKSKCNLLRKSCSWTRKCCKGLKCVPKENGTGMKCAKNKSSATSNESEEETSARNSFVMSFVKFFDALTTKAGTEGTRVPIVIKINDIIRVGNIMQMETQDCRITFEENKKLMLAAQNATNATAIVNSDLAGDAFLTEIIFSLNAQLGWLRGAWPHPNAECDSAAGNASMQEFIDHADKASEAFAVKG